MMFRYVNVCTGARGFGDLGICVCADFITGIHSDILNNLVINHTGSHNTNCRIMICILYSGDYTS